LPNASAAATTRRVRIQTFPAGPIGTNAYLLTDSTRGEALLIDAPHGVWDEIEPVLGKEKCRLVALLLTHGHWDHTGDAARMQRTGVPVYAHEAYRMLIERPEVMALFSIPGIEFEPARIDIVVAQGQKLSLAGQALEVRHVPGHCAGNVLFYFPALDSAFVGDALFAGSIGRTDLPGGNLEQLANSIFTQIYTLPANTVVYPGHGPETTVGDEMSGNPYVHV
jgi:hydroxyacylglutathione hydrolase